MKRTAIIIFSLALIVGFCTYTLFYSTSHDKPPEKAIVPVKTLEKEVSGIENQYAAQLRVLTRENDSLRKVLGLNRRELMLQKQKLLNTEIVATRIIVQTKEVRDTVTKIVYCDSLQTQVDSLISEVNCRDSLWEFQSDELRKEIQNRDSTVTLCQKSFEDLKSATEDSFNQQKTLQDRLNGAEHKLKRRTIQSKVLAAGLLIFSGFAATTLLHR
jgi:hypothetical protein